MEKLIQKIKTNKYELILLLFLVIYTAYFSTASMLRYTNYYTGRFDLGNMDQTVWNTLHGNFFMTTDPNGTREVSRLAFHADFILVLLAPFYLLWEDPRTLLLIQTIILALGGVFVYLIARKVIKDKLMSLLLAACYFLNPAVNYVNLYDFHPVALATTFILAAFYFILKSRYWLAIVFLVLAGLTKEEVWVINAMVGLYLIFIKKQKILGSALTVLSGIIFYILVWIAIPKSLGGEHFALAYYSDYGSSPGEIIKNIIFSPKKTLSTLFLPDRLGYIRQIFLPLGYLSFFGLPFLIFAGPDLIIDLLSSNPTLHQIYYQYSSTVTPFIFLSAIFGIMYLRKKFPEVSLYAFSIFILIATIISAYNFGPLPFAKKPNTDMFTKPLTIKNAVNQYISSVPSGFMITATNNLGSHLSHRRAIYNVPLGIDKADLAMYLISPNTSPDELKSFNLIQNDPDYNLIEQEENFYVFKKR